MAEIGFNPNFRTTPNSNQRVICDPIETSDPQSETFARYATPAEQGSCFNKYNYDGNLPADYFSGAYVAKGIF